VWAQNKDIMLCNLAGSENRYQRVECAGATASSGSRSPGVIGSDLEL